MRLKEKMLKLNSKTNSLFILIITLILGAVLCPSIFAFKSKAYAEGVEYNNYKYLSYHIDLEYDLENKITVTENMVVKFGELSAGTHKGIVRAIPRITTISKGAVSENYKKMFYLDIYNVKGNQLYDYYSEDNIFCIELGGDNYVNETTQNYTISYMVDIGDDFTRDFDFVYYNVFGTDYPVDIESATFSVTLPSDITNDFLCYVGSRKSSQTITLEKQNLSNGKVKFELSDPVYIKAGEGISVKTILDEGYFKGLNGTIKKHQFSNTILIVLACGLTLFVLVAYWMFAQKRKKVVATVEFYPPDDLTPTDTKYLLDGIITNENMSSLFVYWASKGYVAIELDDNKKPKGLRKLQNIPEHCTTYEKSIYSKLFENSEYADITTHNEGLANTITASTGLVKSKIGNRYSTRSRKLKSWAITLSVLLLLSTAYIDLMFSNKNYISLVVYVLSLVCSGCVGLLVNFILNKNKFTSYKLPMLAGVALLVVGYVCANLFLSFIPCMTLATRLLVFVPFMLAFGFKNLADEYDDKWREVIGKIQGFKHNLEIVEGEKLKKLVDEDPEYFYNILPYAYVFGITQKFVKKFEGLTIPYNSNFGTTVDIYYCMALHSTFRNYARVPDSYKGKGFGGGGGSVGGGFGGGGSFGR